MEITKKLNRVVMLAAIVGALSLGTLSTAFAGFGTSPGNRGAQLNQGNAVALTISGISGESLDQKHKTEIEVDCWCSDSTSTTTQK